MPRGWHEIGDIHGGIGKPLSWRVHNAATIGRQPGRPPTQRAVGDDEMPAAGHQSQFLGSAVSGVVLDVGRWHLEREVLFHPGHVVRKYEEFRGFQLGSQLLDGTTVVVFGTEAMKLPDDRIRNIIPPPHMQADGVAAFHPGEQLPVTVRRRSFHREFPADRRHDILEIAIRLPIAVKAVAICQVENGRIKREGTFPYEAWNHSQRMGDRYQ